MKNGFVFGKFMPLHKGHLALIDFALQNCDKLYILLCYTEKEPIPGMIRKEWISNEIKRYPNAHLISFLYDEGILVNSSASSREISFAWAKAFQTIVPNVDILFTSEPYGEYLSEFMNIRHILYDQKKNSYPISASQIRMAPWKYWDFIADSAKSYFVRKVVLIGSESTGKTTLTEKLARHYNTAFVPEMAREIIEKTGDCTYDDLIKIAELHAATILKTLLLANKFLFVDTDIVITKSYSEFLFNKELIVEQWIEEANQFDLYLFLEPDCGYIQDGTRISESERSRLSDHHKAAFQKAGLSFVSIYGNWEQRFSQAKKLIDKKFPE